MSSPPTALPSPTSSPSNTTSPPSPPAVSPPSPPAASPPASSPPPTSSPPPPRAPAPDSSPPSPLKPPITPPPPPAAPSPTSPTPPSKTPPSPPAPTTARPPPPGHARSPPPPPPPPPHHSSNSSPPPPSKPDSSGLSTGVVIGVAIGAVAILAFVTLLFICCCKKKKRRRDHDYYVPPPHVGTKGDPYGFQGQQWQQNLPPPATHHAVAMPPKPSPPIQYISRPPYSPGRPPPPPAPPLAFINSSGGSGSNYSGGEGIQPSSPGMSLGFTKSTFTYEELSIATNGFSEANLLGQGGFGYVHKGVLPNGKEVAVKQLKDGSGQGEREFHAEVETISRVHHKHLVSLVGYCITGSRRLLVYEFVPNNTMEFHLHGTYHCNVQIEFHF